MLSLEELLSHSSSHDFSIIARFNRSVGCSLYKGEECGHWIQNGRGLFRADRSVNLE